MFTRRFLKSMTDSTLSCYTGAVKHANLTMAENKSNNAERDRTEQEAL